jgi:hypothetical protein
MMTAKFSFNLKEKSMYLIELDTTSNVETTNIDRKQLIV